MASDKIRYDILVKDALRDVIKKVLFETAKNGLPGEHHFFITFSTGAPNVKISSRLKARYPDRITIVLQHQFWELEVDDLGFEVSLSFADVSEKVYVPFEAIEIFCDPAAGFESSFETIKHDAIGEVLELVEQASENNTTSQSVDAEKTEKAQIVSLEAFRKNKQEPS